MAGREIIILECLKEKIIKEIAYTEWQSSWVRTFTYNMGTENLRNVGQGDFLC